MAYIMDLGQALEQGTYSWQPIENGKYYAMKNVVYCSNPATEAVFRVRDTMMPGDDRKLPPEEADKIAGFYEMMNIYVPAEFLKGGTVNGYTAKTAPIVLMNICAGWKSSTPSDPYPAELDAGHVFISCGARSRGAGVSADGKDMGKAPIAVVDLKAAVRFLRSNLGALPGDTEKIVSMGCSGGGQMSSILGASGDMAAYYPYLYEIGAVGIEKTAAGFESTVSDSVYAAQCYCPIADLANADMAYAWMRFDAGEKGYFQMMFDAPGYDVRFTPFQLALQNDLAYAYAEYINALGIRSADGELLTFDVGADGRADPRKGTFYNQILDNISHSLNVFLKNSASEKGFDFDRCGMGPMAPPIHEHFESAEKYLATLSDTDSWLKKTESGEYRVTSLAGFINGGLMRNKNIPGFDTFDLTAENDAFGRESETASHFSASVAAVLEKNYSAYSKLEGFDKAVADSYISQAQRPFVKEQTALMNATQILLDGGSKPARHWRTRNGTADEHTSFSVAYDLAMAARANPQVDTVDYGLIWLYCHGEAEGTPSTGNFTNWVDSICK